MCSNRQRQFLSVVLSSVTASASGDLLSYNTTNGYLTGDSGVPAASVVTAGAPSASARQICTATSASSKTCSYIDFPEVFQFPTANVNRLNAGNGWSINTTCGPLPVIYARTGTNLATGYLRYFPHRRAPVLSLNCQPIGIRQQIRTFASTTREWVYVKPKHHLHDSGRLLDHDRRCGFCDSSDFLDHDDGRDGQYSLHPKLSLDRTSMTACTGGNMIT